MINLIQLKTRKTILSIMFFVNRSLESVLCVLMEYVYDNVENKLLNIAKQFLIYTQSEL